MRTLRDEAADAARRREPAVGQEAVSSRSRMRRPVRSKWLTQRHGRLNTACCLIAKGVAKTKQRFDRAVGPAVAPCAQMQPQPQRFFNELKSHPPEKKCQPINSFARENSAERSTLRQPSTYPAARRFSTKRRNFDEFVAPRIGVDKRLYIGWRAARGRHDKLGALVHREYLVETRLHPFDGHRCILQDSRTPSSESSQEKSQGSYRQYE